MAHNYQQLQMRVRGKTGILGYCTVLLRTLRIHAIQQIGPFYSNIEQPKVALYRDRRIAALHFFLHVLPLSAAISLIFLNLISYHVGGVSSLSLTTLQFAAKFLEMLMQASLAAILLAFVRNQMIANQDSIPFGGLLAPYRMTNLSYLWSLEFWGAATSILSSPALKIAFCVLVPAFVILAAFVGPSSAILMIPRIGNYLNANRIAYVGPVDTLYPTYLDLVNGTNADGTNNTMVLSAEQDFNYTVRSIFVSGKSRVDEDSIPITDLFGGWYSRTLNWDVAQPSNQLGQWFIWSATIPTQLTTSVTTDYAGQDMANDYVPVSYQPYVYFKCWQPISCPSEVKFVDFGPGSQNLNETILLGNFTDPSGSNTTFSQTWLDSGADGLDKNRTTVWVPHTNHSILFATTASSSYEEYSKCPTACSVDAYWIMASTQWSDAKDMNADCNASVHGLENSRHVFLSPPLAMRIESITRDNYPVAFRGDSYPIPYDMAEYNVAAIALMMSSSSNLPPSLRLDQNDTDTSGSDFWSRQDMLSVVGPNTLRQGSTTYDEAILYFNNDTSLASDSIAIVTIQAFYTDYRYDSSDITVKLSLVVIFAYVIVVITYLIYSLSTGYAGTSWDSIADLVALALNSQQPEDFAHTSAGIQTLDVFRRPLRIRVANDSSCQLVFSGQKDRHGKQFRDVEANEAY